ncbi:DUF4199 domain-containing protein [Flavobacteriaceae bacterium]|nr:DUF4199 domain-containing protein [Flavobacteriaceae bacterium]MDA9571935.1 DUF4199 domain-containing protein [Flavobacteriaceae bacterium]MDC3354299.1 DUF4199 domain-containing protein [Flavobacteriaceae bacterium]
MENQSVSLKSIILTNALILSGITIAFNLMLYFLDMHYQQSQAEGIVGITIMIAVLIYAFIQFKKANEGFLSLSEALKIGLGISAVSALIGVVYSFILTEVIDPGMMSKTLDFQLEKMRVENPEMTPEQLDGIRSMQEKFSSPLIRSAFQIIASLFIGFIISLIGGLIVKKSQPE